MVRLSQCIGSAGIAQIGSNHGKPTQSPARTSPRGMQTATSPGRAPIKIGFVAARLRALMLAVKWPAEIRTLHSSNPFVKGAMCRKAGVPNDA